MIYAKVDGKYYKDNPERKKFRNNNRMWVNGKYIRQDHPSLEWLPNFFSF
jgi:hypothetical protein